MEKIRILHVVPNMNSGGIENLIMNIYRNIDREKIQFDFLVHYKQKGVFDEEIEKLGGKIYRCSICEDKNVFKYIKELNRFFASHPEYKVVHGHMASLGFIYLRIAKKYKVPIRIAHSHGTSHLKTIKGYIKFLTFKLIKYQANVNFACSTEAGNYLFGRKRKFEIIPNAIDMEKFQYNETIRNEVRKELGITDEFVIGNVGRFNLQKNHLFLLHIFKEIIKQKENSILLLIGIGELEQKIREEIKILHLEDKVKLLGLRKDVMRLYQAMDIFLMPSLFEGLPLTGVEAQTSKLRCYFSDAITKEVMISNNVEFIPIELGAKRWADEILQNAKYDRNSVEILNQDFDIKKLAEKMQKKYETYHKRIFER